MEDDNVYIKKDNGRYEAVGIRYAEWLPDGIWFVRHTKHTVGRTNCNYLEGLHKIGNAEIIDFPKLCGLHEYTEYILRSDAFKEFERKGSYTLMELTSKIVSLVFELNEQHKKECNEDSSSRRYSR